MAKSRRKMFWPLLAPTMVLYLAFMVAPLVYTIYLSFFRWRGLGAQEFRGWGNYTQLLGDDTFRTAFRNTLILAVGVGIAVFVASFA